MKILHLKTLVSILAIPTCVESLFPKCSNFNYSIGEEDGSDNNIFMLQIPKDIFSPYVTSENGYYEVPLTSQPLKCYKNLWTFTLSWDLETRSVRVSKDFHSWRRSFWKHILPNGTHKIRHYLGENGWFFNGIYYMNPQGEYCIQNYTKNSIVLSLCPPSSNSVYLPKCCVMGSYFNENRKCFNVDEYESNNPFYAQLYQLNNLDTNHLKFFIYDLKSTCSMQSPSRLASQNELAIVDQNRSDRFKIITPAIVSDERIYTLKNHIHYCIDSQVNASINTFVSVNCEVNEGRTMHHDTHMKIKKPVLSLCKAFRVNDTETKFDIPKKFQKPTVLDTPPLIFNLRYNQLDCNEDTAILKTLNFSESTFYNQNLAYFTNDGYFFNGSFYFRPSEQYCVLPLENNVWVIKICPLEKNSILIPKCCSHDEVFDSGTKKCVSLQGSTSLWKPQLFTSENKLLDYSFKQLRMYKSNLLGKCVNKSSPYGLHGIYSYSFDHRKHKNVVVNLVLNTSIEIRFFGLNLADQQFNVQLVSDERFMCIDEHILSWQVVGNNSDVIYSVRDRETDFIVNVCLTSELLKQKLYLSFPHRTYLLPKVCDVITLIILVILVLLKVFIAGKQNLNGILILNYCVALLGEQITVVFTRFGIEYFLDVFFDSELTCLTVILSTAILSLTTFTWMSVLNIDMMLSLRSNMPMNRGGGIWKRVLIYSALAWGLPAIFIFICLIFAFYTASPEQFWGIYVGSPVCISFILTQHYFGPFPAGVLAILNIPVILMTQRVIVKAKRQRDKMFNSQDSSQTGNVHQIGWSLLLKLFVIMGGDLILKAVIYIFVDVEETELAWPVILTTKTRPAWPFVLDTATRTCMFALLFVLLCFNDQSKKQFQERLTEIRGMCTNSRQ